MLNKIIKRFVLGFIYEVFVAYLITILISLSIGDGNYYGINKGIMNICTTELGAVVFQFVLAGLLGAVFGVTTIFWEIDKWSLAKQTVIHFLVVTTSMLITAYICNWMRHTLASFFCWLGLFVVVYVIAWIICYNSFKRKVQGINKTISQKNS